MSNERRLRLIQVAKEFNVGINTITDFLHKKGIKNDGSPNALVDADTYAVRHFVLQKVQCLFADYLRAHYTLGHIGDHVFGEIHRSRHKVCRYGGFKCIYSIPAFSGNFYYLPKAILLFKPLPRG